MMDALIFMLENQFSVFLRDGVSPKPNGNRYIVGSPVGDFRCGDGRPVMLNITTDLQWERFAQALEQPQWLEDPDFASMSLRTQNYRKVEAEVVRVFSRMDSAEVCARLEKHHCAYGVINDFEGVKNHPQVTHRKMIVRANYSNGVTFQTPGNPIHMSGMEREEDYKTALLGEDTFDVLSEVADLDTLHNLFDPIMAQVAAAGKEMYQKS